MGRRVWDCYFGVREFASGCRQGLQLPSICYPVTAWNKKRHARTGNYIDAVVSECGGCVLGLRAVVVCCGCALVVSVFAVACCGCVFVIALVVVFVVMFVMMCLRVGVYAFVIVWLVVVVCLSLCDCVRGLLVCGCVLRLCVVVVQCCALLVVYCVFVVMLCVCYVLRRRGGRRKEAGGRRAVLHCALGVAYRASPLHVALSCGVSSLLDFLAMFSRKRASAS